MAFYLLAARTTGDQWAYYYHGLGGSRGAVDEAPAAALGEAGGAAALAAAGPWQPRLAWGLAAATVLWPARHGGGPGRAPRRRPRRGPHAVCVQSRARGARPARRPRRRARRQQVDEHGHPVAWNASMAFAWMDRRGFNYPIEDLDVATLDGIAARGGRYWVASPDDLGTAGVRAWAEARYRRVATCGDGGYALYDLRPDLPARGA
ncbi:MAG: hypothetical protein U0802_22820 [Candidatus Binatia bacterium]